MVAVEMKIIDLIFGDRSHRTWFLNEKKEKDSSDDSRFVS